MICEKIKSVIGLIRIKHWIKNLLVFAPLFFSGQICNLNSLISMFLAFMAFNFLASSIYIFNDICDVEYDKKHEVKCERPIAKGIISIKEGYLIISVLMIISIAMLVISKPVYLGYTLIIYFLYLACNIFYSCYGKKVPILDVALLAAGFLFRVFFGSFVVGVFISEWMFLVILAGAFYFGLGKRKNELLKNKDDTRSVLKYYSYSFLNNSMNSSMTLMIVFYSLWCSNNTVNGKYLLFTVPLIIIIAMKYSHNIEKDVYGDPVEVLFGDIALIILGIIWAAAISLIIYF